MMDTIQKNAHMILPGSTIFWLVFLVWGCANHSEWWPLCNVLFVVFAALPPMFGSLASTELWGAIGDFVMGCCIISVFGFPTVLYNVEALPGFDYSLILISDLFLLVAVFFAILRFSPGSSVGYA